MRRLAALAVLLLATPAAAFPDRPITIVLPYAPASAADAYSRALGEHWQREMGQPVVVTSRDGAAPASSACASSPTAAPTATASASPP
jgi:tripartite-type tricarboxylate transporter receptor subunit TctC